MLVGPSLEDFDRQARNVFSNAVADLPGLFEDAAVSVKGVAAASLSRNLRRGRSLAASAPFTGVTVTISILFGELPQDGAVDSEGEDDGGSDIGTALITAGEVAEVLAAVFLGVIFAVVVVVLLW